MNPDFLQHYVASRQAALLAEAERERLLRARSLPPLRSRVGRWLIRAGERLAPDAALAS
jgi:hypothetical protein